MKRRTSRLAAIGLAAGLVVGGASLASAGHLNPLLEADLDGRSEVSSDAKSKRIVGDPNGRGEGYVFGIDDDTRGGVVTENDDTLCYVLIVDGIDELELAPGNGRMAHIHRGAEGENGPVVANLAWPQDGQRERPAISPRTRPASSRPVRRGSSRTSSPTRTSTTSTSTTTSTRAARSAASSPSRVTATTTTDHPLITV